MPRPALDSLTALTPDAVSGLSGNRTPCSPFMRHRPLPIPHSAPPAPVRYDSQAAPARTLGTPGGAAWQMIGLPSGHWRIDQPTAAAAAAAALVAAPRRQPLRHPRRRQPPTAAPERPSAAAAAARTGRRGRTAAGDDATRCGIGRGTPPFHVAAGPRFGWVSERRSCSPARNSTGNPAQGPRQRLQLAAPSAAAAGKTIEIRSKGPARAPARPARPDWTWLSSRSSAAIRSTATPLRPADWGVMPLRRLALVSGAIGSPEPDTGEGTIT